jgi:DNA-binding transcriptional MerR regulator
MRGSLGMAIEEIARALKAEDQQQEAEHQEKDQHDGHSRH